jgi:hypothetical protein
MERGLHYGSQRKFRDMVDQGRQRLFFAYPDTRIRLNMVSEGSTATTQALAIPTKGLLTISYTLIVPAANTALCQTTYSSAEPGTHETIF